MPVRGQPIATPARRQEFVEQLRSLGPGDECVPWPWSTKNDGYTRIYVNGEKVQATRWVYEQINGEIGDLNICHSCDTPSCVRPSHLWAGTHEDNLRDASRKGRMRGGSVHRSQQLTARDAGWIRALHAEGVRQSVIARAFGVSPSQVNQIVRGRRWITG